MNKRKTFILTFVLLLTAVLSTSCMSVDKYLQPHEHHLVKNTFTVTMPDGTTPPKEINEALSNVENYVVQEPNKRLLGKVIPWKVKMRIYCMSSPSDSNWINNYLRRIGEAPVVFDRDATAMSCMQIANLLKTKGCFNSAVTYDTVPSGKHGIEVNYIITPSPRYSIDKVSFRAETSEVDKKLQEQQSESLLRSGDYYDQEMLDNERNRVIQQLRNDGYFHASNDLITFLIDTSFGNNKLDMQMHLRNPLGAMQKRVPLQQYRIGNVYIYPNTSLANTTANTQDYDTTVYTTTVRNREIQYNFLNQTPPTLKPQAIARSLYLPQGSLFRQRNIERTSNALIGMRNFKYINIDVQESPLSNASSPTLDAHIHLLSAKRKRITASLEINNSSPTNSTTSSLSSGNLGLEAKIGYTNKNLFGGGEQFKTEGSMLVELPKLMIRNSDENDLRQKVNNFENAIDMSLDMPVFLFPFSSDIMKRRTRPHTLINLGAAYQYRSYFERIIFNTSFGYTWSRQHHSHQLLPIEATFVRFFNIDNDFRNRMESISDARLKYQYSDHFIVDARYDYTYNTQVYNTRQDFDYLHVSFESAGNLLWLIGNVTGTARDDNGILQLLGVPFSQYVRLNGEYKHYFYFGRASTYVARIIAGIGLPYSNSYVMPYEKGFYGGGQNTIRAWQLRHLGPGTFQTNETMLERVGDIQLVINLEHRFPIVSIFEGALFADIGNVWLVHNSEEFPGGQFKFNQFVESIATGVGLGLRAKISILTLRCDFAIPLFDPGMEKSQRWRPPYWKLNQITTNFGIDYPF